MAFLSLDLVDGAGALNVLVVPYRYTPVGTRVTNHREHIVVLSHDPASSQDRQCLAVSIVSVAHESY